MILNLALLVRVICIRPKRIWVGDSHSLFIGNHGNKMRAISLSNSGDLVFWLGPKLMHSISRDGFAFSRFFKLLMKFSSTNKVLIVVLGEIDCRVHLTTLVKNNKIDEIRVTIQKYWNQVHELCNRFGFEYSVILTPVPPSDKGIDNLEFPRTGSIEERIGITSFVSDELEGFKDERVRVIKLNSILSDTDGTLSSAYTDDGVHVNALGSKVVISSLTKLKLV